MKKFLKIFVIAISISFFQNPIFAQTNSEDIRTAAKLLYMSNKPQQAQIKLLEIPENERITSDYLLLGNTFSDLYKQKEAIASYEKAISMDKTFYKAYYNLANFYLSNYKNDEAIKYYKLSVKYKKDFGYAYYNMGCAYLNNGDFSGARKSFEKAILLKMDEPNLYYNLAYIHKKEGSVKKAQKALDLYNQLMKNRNEN